MTLPPKRFQLLDKGTFLLMCILMADCCFSGSGMLVSFGPFSFRLVLTAITMLSAAVIMLQQVRKLLKNPIIWSVAFFMIWVLIETLIGIWNGNSMGLILTDLKGFCYFAFFPVAICVLNSRERIHKLMKVMAYSSGALGLFSVIHLVLYLIKPDWFNYLYIWGLRVSFSGFNSISPTIPRLFFYGSGYLICGCAFSAYLQIKSSNWHIPYIVIIGVNLFAILMTYTRSLFVSAAVAAAVLVVGSLVYQDKREHKQLWKSLGGAALAFCLLLGSFSVGAKTDYLRYAIDRSIVSFDSMDVGNLPTQPSTSLPTEPIATEPITKPPVIEPIPGGQEIMASDQTRLKTLVELLNRVKGSPIIGHGLGSVLDVRDGENHEFFWLDLLMKGGIIGFAAYLLPVVFMCVWMICGLKKRQKQWLVAVPWLAVLVGFIVYSIFTPEMNCSNGILFYSCAAGVCHTIQNEPILTDR